MAICPFCGGAPTRFEFSDSAGTRATALCCGVPLEFIDNHDVYESLPEPLQRVAIDRKLEEYTAMDRQSAENAARFAIAREHWDKTYGHLYK